MPKRTTDQAAAAAALEQPIPAALEPSAEPTAETRQLRVLEWLENPAGGFWTPGTILPWDALRPESITILMERQIVIVHVPEDELATLPIADA